MFEGWYNKNMKVDVMNINAFVMKLGVFLLALFLFSGCGSNNSQTLPSTAPVVPDGNATTAIASMSVKGGSEKIASVSGGTVDIEIRGLTKSNTLASGDTVVAVYLDPDSSNSGDLTATTAVMESTGIAKFTYIAPKDLQAQIDAGNTGTSFKFYSQSDTSISTTVHILFDTTIDTAGGDPIASFTLSSYNFSVTSSSDTKEIKVTAKNSDGSYVANGKVGIKQLTNAGSVDVGSTNSEAVITKGIGTFTYTPPVDLINAASASPVQFQVCDKVNTSVCQVFSVSFTSATVGTVKLSVSPYTGTIVSAGGSLPVTVLVTDLSGKAVTEGFIEVYNASGATAGYFDKAEAPIGDGGIASFQYTGPSPLSSGYGQFIFKLKDYPQYYTTWRVNFVPPAGESTTPIATLVVDRNITANNTKSIPVNVAAFTSVGAYAQSGSVSVRPQNAVGNIGSFKETQVNVGKNGIATFTFNPPDPLVNQADQIFIFTSDSGVSTHMKVSYVPQIDAANPVADTLVILNGSDINITKNSEVVNIRIRVYGVDNNPFDGGNVKIQFPDVAVSGTDVGYFSELIVPCVNGIADFTYNAPSNIAGRSDTFPFVFYHDSAGSSAQSTLNVTMNPDPNQIVITTYELNLLPSDGNLSMGLETIKAFTAKVTDENGNEISEGNYTVSNLNTDLADILDTDGSASDTLTKNNEKNIVFRIQTGQVSGLIPLKISVVFRDVNGDIQTLEKVFNIVVFSGPPTSISINYTTTDFDQAYSEFTEHFVVTVADEYGNPINTQPGISVGAIVGFATLNAGDPYNPSNHIYFQPNGTTTGSINTTNDQFTTTNPILGNLVGQSGDYKLAIIPPEYHYDAGGKWDFNYVSTSVLNLVDEYNGANRSGLGFAIGNNQRVRTCEIGAKENATVTISDGSNQLDEKGRALIDMAYRPYLVGKDIVLWVNIVGYKNEDDSTGRVGTGRKFTLQGNGLATFLITIPKYASGHKTIYISQSGVNRQPYFNANFLSNLEATGDVQVSNEIHSAVTNCSSDIPGQAWVGFDYNSSAEGGTITITPVIRNEIQ